MPTDEQITFILDSAIRAPSADNQHRIRFTVAGETIRVRYTERALPPPGSYQRMLVLLSLGAVVENIRIAASRFGIAAQISIPPEAEQPDLVLLCRLQRQGLATDPLVPYIPSRHTNRQLHFRGPRMSDAQLNELASAAGRYSGSKLFWFDEATQRQPLLHLMRRAETERFRNRMLHQELFSAIRFDVGWQHSCAEGLPPGSLGVEPPLRPFFSLLRQWSIMRRANTFGMDRLLGFRSCYLPCRLAPHLGVLAVENTDSGSILDAGSAFQRLWLVVTQHGRALQPLPAAALYAASGAATADGIDPDLQRQLAAGWRTLIGEAVPMMAFRIGVAPPSPVVTGRHALAHYCEV